VSVSYPLPGTKFHDRVSAQLGDKRNWDESADLDPLFPGVYPRDFYQRLSRTVHAELRARRALRALAELVRHPRRADRARVRAVGGLLALPIWLAGNARLRGATARTFAGQKPAGTG
jgi:anaerobic magnesium-protoporphyrin IX monomethyl ester cyclase